MFWKIVQLLFGLAIVVPILGMVYYRFTNTTNGTFVNSTEVNSTALGVTTAELSFWNIAVPIIAIMLLVGIAMVLAGAFNKEGGE